MANLETSISMVDTYIPVYKLVMSEQTYLTQGALRSVVSLPALDMSH